VGVSLFNGRLTLITLLRQYSLYARDRICSHNKAAEFGSGWIDLILDLADFFYLRDYGGEIS